MYGGESVEVVLEFDDTLISVVYDKFGEDIKITRKTEGACTASVNVQVSPVFWGWIFQFVESMTIVSPDYLCEEYIARAAMICSPHRECK